MFQIYQIQNGVKKSWVAKNEKDETFVYLYTDWVNGESSKLWVKDVSNISRAYWCWESKEDLQNRIK